MMRTNAVFRHLCRPILPALLLSSLSGHASAAQPPATEPLTMLAEYLRAPTAAVAAAGDTAYVGVGPRLIVLDLAGESPIRIGMSTPYTSTVQSIALHGDTAVLAMGAAGLRVIDVSDPTRLAEVAHVPGRAERVHVEDSRAYVQSEAIAVYDLADPAAPEHLGSVTVQARGFDVDADRVYVAIREDGVRIFDLTDPAAPTELAAFDTPGVAHDVSVSGSTAYVADGELGMRIVDVSDPTATVEIGSFQMDGCDPPDSCPTATKVSVKDEVAYVVTFRCSSPFQCRYQPGIRAVDVSDPSAPTQLHEIGVGGNPADFALAGERVFLAETPLWWYAGIAPCQLAPGRLTVLSAELEELGTYAPMGGAASLAYTAGHLLVVDPVRGLRELDVTDPAAPRPSVTRAPVTRLGSSYGIGSLTDVDVNAAGSTFVTRGPAGSEHTRMPSPLRAGNPSAAPQNGCSPPPSDKWFQRVRGSGGHIFVLDGGGMLRIVEAPNSETGYWLHSAIGRELDVAWPVAYVADEGGTLWLVDVSDPTEPQALSAVEGSAVRVFAAGSRVFVANGQAGLRILDVTDPTAPVEVGAIDTPGVAVDVHVPDHMAYVADGAGGVRMIDVSNPATPVESGAAPELHGARRVHAAGGSVYVIATGGVFVLAGPTARPQIYLPYSLRH